MAIKKKVKNASDGLAFNQIRTDFAYSTMQLFILFIFLLRHFRDIPDISLWKSHENSEMENSNVFQNPNSNNYESLPGRHTIRVL